MKVEVRGNDVNGALKVLKKKLYHEGLIAELRDRRFYEKPSEARRRRGREAVKRARRARRERHNDYGIPF